ncbi:MAG: AMP-binding protein [Candidatus Obscuribacterales bacterium]|nr:AMP-binding protein [Candidatus Obscuribacterales bacterium]
MESVATNITEVRPTIMNAVPRFYEKAYNRIQGQIRLLPTPQAYFARWALSLGRRALKATEENTNGKREVARQIYRTELRVADRFVFRKIRQRFGGRLRFLVSGAAPLSTEVHQFFGSIGIPILEGYGLTETTAPISCNKPEDNKRGSVGKPLPGVEVKIAADGEIMARGPSIFGGYYKNEEATKAAFNDGWFLTGDIGEIDADGYLTIKDRKKDIIITAGGKHVAPQVLENMLAGQGLISRVLVYGDRRKYISALVTLNPDELKVFAVQNNIQESNADLLCKHPKIIEAVQEQINETNARLASFEQIKRFLLMENDFTIETDELTPTLKIKRKFVTEKFKTLLDSLYEKEDVATEI